MSSTSLEPYGPLPSRKDVKESRRVVSAGSLCKQCYTNSATKQCPRCKMLYCSKECQKEDWPKHKRLCRDAESEPDVKKLCQALMANVLLRRYIEVLIILNLNLLQKADIEEPFRAQIVIGFEPASIADFFEFFDPAAVIDDSPLQGMFQIYQFLPDGVNYDGISQNATFPESELEKRRTGSRLKGLPVEGLPYGVIQFIYPSAGPLIICAMDIFIQEQNIALARQANALEIPINVGATTTIKKPLSASSCVELINMLIRHDTKNHWLLRINMDKKRKQMVKDAFRPCARPPTDAGSIGLRQAMGIKMLREAIYAAYILHFNLLTGSN